VRARVSLTTLKRLEVLERGKVAVRTIGVWPGLLGYDEWEAQAMAHQDKLCSDTRGEDHVVIADSLPDPMDVTHRYRRHGNLRVGQTPEERAWRRARGLSE